MKKILFSRVLCTGLGLSMITSCYNFSYAANQGNSTSTSSNANTFVAGGASITQNEYQRGTSGLDPFMNNRPLYPCILNDTSTEEVSFTYGDSYTTNLQMNSNDGNWIDKIVTVKNNSNVPAYVRTIFAFRMLEDPLGNWIDPVAEEMLDLNVIQGLNDQRIIFPVDTNGDKIIIEIDGIKYVVGEYYYKETYGDEARSVVYAGEETHPSLIQIALKNSRRGMFYEMCDGTYEVLVFSQACSTSMYKDETSAKDALDRAFGKIEEGKTPWNSDSGTKFVVGNTQELSVAFEQRKSNIELSGKVTVNNEVSNIGTPEEEYYSALVCKDGSSLSGGQLDLKTGETAPIHVGLSLFAKKENEADTCNDISVSNVKITNNRRIDASIMAYTLDSNVAIENVTIENSNAAVGIWGTAEDTTTECISTLKNCNITVSGSRTTHRWLETAVAVSNGGVINIESGNYKSGNYVLYVFSSGGKINVTGGTFKGTSIVAQGVEGKLAYINISGGTFDIESFSKNDYGTITITGGKFKIDPSAYVDSNVYTVSDVDDEGYYTVSKKA